MTDEPLGVPQRAPEEGEHLDRGQDADEGGQARPQHGAADDVARAGQQTDGRCCGGEPQQARQRQPRVRRARLGQDAPQRSPVPCGAHGEPTSGSPTVAGSVSTVSKWGRRSGSCAATTTMRPASHGSIAGARRAQRSADRARRWARRAATRALGGAGRGPGRRVALARAEGEAVVPDDSQQPGGQVGQQVGEPHGFEHPVQILVGRVGGAQPEVLGQGRVEEMRPLRQPREVITPRRDGLGGAGLLVVRHAALARLDEAQQRRQHRRLARSRRPRQGEARPGSSLKRDTDECGALPVLVAHAETVDRQAAGTGTGADADADAVRSRALYGDVRMSRTQHGRLEHLDDPRRGGLPFGAGVELGPGVAHRDEDLRRDEEDGHCGLQVELAPQQPEPEHHGDEPDSEAGDHVHGERGQEGDTERAHGGGTHAFGRRLHLAPSLRLATEGAAGWGDLRRAAGHGRRASSAGATGAPTAWSLPGRRRSWSRAPPTPGR